MRILIIFVLLFSYSASAQSIHYNLRMTKPQNHYFEVEMELKNFKEKELTVKMPVWAPGSYLIREFSKNVNIVRAFDENNNALKVNKTAKNAWLISKGKAKSVKVQYEVYAFELSVRTSFLDLNHGFVSGSGIFCYVDKYKEKPGTLNVFPHESFSKISTALEKSDEALQNDSYQAFKFPNYDVLLDCPMEIGNQEVFNFKAGGTDHQVAIFGIGNYDKDDLKKDMARIVEAETDVFGGKNPNKNYTFIIHNVINGQGGLEHANSTVLSVNRWSYAPSQYKDFLSLVAHEYFHLWNVKRIRPIELGPFNYDQENYTSLLWVMEGFTSYYDELILVRAGYMTKDEYLSKLQGTVNYVEGSVGARVQPVAHSSYDAWIKGYRPNENSSNTGMTYYSRGAMLGAYLDAMIIHETKASKCLDHFMRYLLEEFYVKKNRGFTALEFQEALEKFIGKDMDFFFDKYVNGTETPNFKEIFEKVGVNVSYSGVSKPSFGATLGQDAGKCMIRGIRSNSSAEEAGLSVGDEVLACNMMRVDQNSLETFMASLISGEKANLIISRDDVISEIEVTIKNFERPAYKFVSAIPSNENYYYWLRTID